MKVIQFTVPVSNEGSVVIQEDILPYFYHYLHRHKEAQITLIIKGEGTLIVGNYTQPFKAGEIYIIGANQPHMFKGDARYFENLQEKNIHAVHIFFDQTRLKPLFDFSEFEQVNKFLENAKGSLHLNAKYSEKVTNDILHICQLKGLERLLQFVYLLQFFSTQVTDWKSLSTGFASQPYTESEGIRMNDIFQYTIENYAKQISLVKIASVAHMTPHAFCKYFKRHTRKTYLSFLNEIRINEACKTLLKGQPESIAIIAYAVGFNSAITFNRVFKKIIGMSPSDYVKEYKFKKASRSHHTSR